MQQQLEMFGVEPEQPRSKAKRREPKYAGIYQLPDGVEWTPRQARNEAVERVEANNESFVDRCYVIILAVAQSKAIVTADDLWERLSDEERAGVDPRALGAVFLRASKGGLIEKTNRTVASKRAVNHGREIRVWRSLLYQGDT